MKVEQTEDGLEIKNGNQKVSITIKSENKTLDDLKQHLINYLFNFDGIYGIAEVVLIKTLLENEKY